MIIRKESFFNGLILSYTCHYQSYYFSSWLKTFTLYLVCTYCVTISSLSLKEPHSTQCVLSNSTLGHYPFHFTTPPLNLSHHMHFLKPSEIATVGRPRMRNTRGRSTCETPIYILFHTTNLHKHFIFQAIKSNFV